MTDPPATPRQGLKRIDRGRGHSYTLDGKPVIGVTTALQALPKYLTSWAAGTVAEYVVDNIDSVEAMLTTGGRGPTVDYLRALPNQVRNTAGVRGTAVHKLAEPLANGEEVDVPDYLVGYVESCAQFLDDWNPEFLHTEYVVGSRTHSYAGTSDGICRIPSLGRVGIDWKTASGVYGENALQLSGYRYADFFLDGADGEQPLPELDGCYVVHLRQDGYDLVPVDAGPDTFQSFVGVLDIYRRLIRKDGTPKTSRMQRLVGAPLLPPRLTEKAS